MARKRGKRTGKARGGEHRLLDPLEEIEAREGVELSGKMHKLAEKPVKPLKRARGLDEQYHHSRRS